MMRRSWRQLSVAIDTGLLAVVIRMLGIALTRHPADWWSRLA